MFSWFALSCRHRSAPARGDESIVWCAWLNRDDARWRLPSSSRILQQITIRHLHDVNLKLLLLTFVAMKNPIPFLRTIALVEGVSFLVLLGIAMPLKYFAGLPLAVKLVGWIHGVLFVVFCAALLQTMLMVKWPLLRGAVVFVAALLPFGPFLLDRRMRTYEAEARERVFRTPEADLT
jgi:integral membrane protein